MTAGQSTLLLCCAGLCAGAVTGWLTLPDAPVTPAATAKASAFPPSVLTRGSTLPASTVDKQSATDHEQQLTAYLEAGGTDPFRMQALFMSWFEREPDLWSHYEELQKRFPSAAGPLATAFFTAWAWHDFASACEKAHSQRKEARAAAWLVGCALGNEAVASLGSLKVTPESGPLERLAARDPASALTILKNVHEHAELWEVLEVAPPAVAAVLRGWIALDGPEAVKWAASPEGSASAFRFACLEWQRRDPGALAGLEGPLKEKAAADRVVSAVMGGAANVQPEDAAAAALALDPFDPATLRNLEAADDDAPLPLPWMEPESTAKLPPAEAVARLLATPVGADSSSVLSTIMIRFVREDPRATAAFLESHLTEVTDASEPGRISWNNAINNATRAWAHRDLPAATEWAASLPDGLGRDAAVGGFLETLSDYDPEAALSWIATMRNPGSGSEDLKRAIRELTERAGKTAARHAVEASALPAATKQELLKSL